jgi:peroxiredoxin Q/BCP
MPTSLKPGDRAPDFSAPSWDGSTVSLSDFKGDRSVALFFYVRDNTTGCTREARALRDAAEGLADSGVAVVGVSTDSVESHERFATNNELGYPLLSDADGKLAKAYGVLTPAGRAERTTFLIGRDGVIHHVWPKVSITGHADDIIARASELT